jgi:hypothetical protein
MLNTVEAVDGAGGGGTADFLLKFGLGKRPGEEIGDMGEERDDVSGPVPHVVDGSSRSGLL